MESNSRKTSLFDRALYFALFVFVAWIISGETLHLYSKLDTIKKTPNLFEKHYTVNGTFPFVGNYYLMKPKSYSVDKRYPLIVDLHGISKHAYGAEELAKNSMRTKFPVFVIVPMAPKRAFWLSPNDKNYMLPRPIAYPDHMPHVLQAIRTVQESFNIDDNKVFITGHSMGAGAVIGALHKYPDIFKGGVASAGLWSPQEISNIRSPLYLYHGTRDANIPYRFSAGVAEEAKRKQLPVRLITIKNAAHGIAPKVYSNPKLWAALLK